MEIKILGSGCKKCTTLYDLAKQASEELEIETKIEKVTDFKDILSYGVMTTPGIVVDGAVKASGRVPSKDEIKKFLSE